MKTKFISFITLFAMLGLLLTIGCHGKGASPVELEIPDLPEGEAIITEIGDGNGDEDEPEVGDPTDPYTGPHINVTCPGEDSYKIINGFTFDTIKTINIGANLLSYLETKYTLPEFHLGGPMDPIATLSKAETGSNDLILWSEGSYLYMSYGLNLEKDNRVDLLAAPEDIAVKKLKDGNILVAVALHFATLTFNVVPNGNSWQAVQESMHITPFSASRVGIFESPNSIEINNKKLDLNSPDLPTAEYLYTGVRNKGIMRINVASLKGGCVERLATINADNEITDLASNGNMLAFRSRFTKKNTLKVKVFPFLPITMEDFLASVLSAETVKDVNDITLAFSEPDETFTRTKVLNLLNGKVAIPPKPFISKDYVLDLMVDDENLYTATFSYDMSTLGSACDGMSGNDLSKCMTNAALALVFAGLAPPTAAPPDCSDLTILLPEDVAFCTLIETTNTSIVKYNLKTLFDEPQPAPIATNTYQPLSFYKLISSDNGIYMRSQSGLLQEYNSATGAITELTPIGDLRKQINNLAFSEGTLITTAVTGIDLFDTTTLDVDLGPDRFDPTTIVYLATNDYIITPNSANSAYSLYDLNSGISNELAFKETCTAAGKLKKRFIRALKSGNLLQVTVCKVNNDYIAHLETHDTGGNTIATLVDPIHFGPCDAGCVYEPSETIDGIEILSSGVEIHNVKVKDDKIYILSGGFQIGGEKENYKVTVLSESMLDVVTGEGVIYKWSTTSSFVKENADKETNKTYLNLSDKLYYTDQITGDLSPVDTTCAAGDNSEWLSIIAFKDSNNKDVLFGIGKVKNLIYWTIDSGATPPTTTCNVKDVPTMPELNYAKSVRILPKAEDVIIYTLHNNNTDRFFVLKNITDITINPEQKKLHSLYNFALTAKVRSNDTYMIAPTYEDGIEFYLWSDLLAN